MDRENGSLIHQNRIFVWIAIATAAILLVPLIAMQFSAEVDWNAADFIIMGSMLFGFASVFVLISRRVTSRPRVVVGVLIVMAFLFLWAELAVGIFTDFFVSPENSSTSKTAQTEELSAVDFSYISVSENRIQTLHDIQIEVSAGDNFRATEPKNRVDEFDGTPYNISLAALINDSSALMIHAETVADLSGASDYSNLAQADWPDDTFRSSGPVCMDVPAEAIEGEHDLEWLRDNGFEPIGTMVFAQYFAATNDKNAEIVLSILVHIESCGEASDSESLIADFQSRISVTH
ncbi:MAG: hypothetical protein ACR2QL_05080 [Woeseiaceae bacterium]